MFSFEYRRYYARSKWVLSVKELLTEAKWVLKFLNLVSIIKRGTGKADGKYIYIYIF